MGVRAAARGSGASSLVNYLIDVSQVNPLQHDLIFERFLSRDRATLPDIDIDVESAERHNVYRKIFDRFGAERHAPLRAAGHLPGPAHGQQLDASTVHQDDLLHD